MSWARIDDAMPDSLKIAPLSDAAFRAYVTSICYCARSLTDGLVPTKKAKEFASKTRVMQELVPDLWEPAQDGFTVHDYLQYNPTRAKVIAEREAAAERMKRVRSPEHQPNFGRSSASPSPTPLLTTPPEIREGGSSNTGEQRSSPEVRLNEELPPAYSGLKNEWENRIGFLPLHAVHEFRHFAGALPQVWFMSAIEKTVKAPRPSWEYCKPILVECERTQEPPGGGKKVAAAAGGGDSLRYRRAK